MPGSSTGSTSSGSGSSNPSQPTQSNPGQQPWSWLQQWLQGQQQVSIQPIGTPTSGGPPYVGNPGGQSGEAPWTPGHPSATGAAQFFAAFHLPQWIAAQWVAEHGGVLPWNPGTTPTPAQQQALNDWLNAKGYRDPQSGAFLPVVSSPSIPQPVAQEIQAAGINWGP
ncbi:MAG: hypothetical protein KGO96_13905 [Elusimicrobia bacterium]|nr:hypothetical protein [Elusimicrobiota bacterium]